MKQIIKDLNEYTSNNIINKYLYYKEERQDSYLYFILIVKSIDYDETNITYYTDKCYLLYVPKNLSNKCFVYDNYTKVNISTKIDLYEMTFAEFVNTFREFIKYDGKLASELPSKIIQDSNY